MLDQLSLELLLSVHVVVAQHIQLNTAKSTWIPTDRMAWSCVNDSLFSASNQTVTAKCNCILSSSESPQQQTAGLCRQIQVAWQPSFPYRRHIQYASNTKLIIRMDATPFRLQSKHGLDDGWNHWEHFPSSAAESLFCWSSSPPRWCESWGSRSPVFWSASPTMEAKKSWNTLHCIETLPFLKNVRQMCNFASYF